MTPHPTDPDLVVLSDEELRQMDEMFPPIKMSFPNAIVQIQAGREVKRADKPYWLGCGDNERLTARDIAADDWVICG
jgi:hypothetical protein